MSPIAQNSATQRTVGIGEMIMSASPKDTIITYSLGSCVGLSLFDPTVNVGGLIHCMLPMSSINPEKAEKQPYLFTDTGIIKMLREMIERGASKKSIIAKVAGGAQMLDKDNHFRIGDRNYLVLKKVLWKNNILLNAEDVGGMVSRTMLLDMSDGKTYIRSNGTQKELT